MKKAGFESREDLVHALRESMNLKSEEKEPEEERANYVEQTKSLFINKDETTLPEETKEEELPKMSEEEVFEKLLQQKLR